MTRIGSIAFVVAFAGGVAAQQPQLPPPPGAPAEQTPRDAARSERGTGRIRGRVIAADTGAPLRGARIALYAPELPEGRATSTDADGRYEFRELPPGRYQLEASKGSYLRMNYGERRPFEEGTPLQLAPGETIERVDFALPRGGVITGKVIDEYGEPVSDVMVTPQRHRFVNGRRQLVPVGRYGETNDLGEFRVYGLPPSQYYVVATQQNRSRGDSDERRGYAPTFYPDTSDEGQAQRVSVGVGQTLNDVNITLTVTRVARMMGTVTDAGGRLVTDGFVTVGLRGAFRDAGGPIRADGSFVISDLPPGEYDVQWSKSGDESVPQFGRTTVTMAGEDVTDVRLTETRPARAIGRVVLDGATADTARRAFGLRLGLMPQKPDQTAFGPYRGGGDGAIKEDFTFQLSVRPCVCVVRYFGPDIGWYLRAVRLNGSDVTDSGIDFRADQQVDGIEVEMTMQTTNLSGMVTDERGEPSRDYAVIVFSQDREDWFPRSRRFAQARPDQNGRFNVRGLPAGRYYAVAVASLEPGEENDADLLEQLRPQATSLSLADGEGKSVDLRLVAR